MACKRFRITCPGFPSQRASNAQLWLNVDVSQQAVEQRVELPEIWEAKIVTSQYEDMHVQCSYPTVVFNLLCIFRILDSTIKYHV